MAPGGFLCGYSRGSRQWARHWMEASAVKGEIYTDKHYPFAHAAETEAFLADETDYFSMAYQAVLAVDDIGIACAE